MGISALEKKATCSYAECRIVPFLISFANFFPP